MDLGCPLLRGSSDRRLRRCAATLPLLLERTFPGSVSFSVFGTVTAAMKDLVEEKDSPGLITWIKSFVISCCIRRLPTAESAYVHQRRRYWGRFWWLRWLRAIVFIVYILCLIGHCHSCQDVKWIGRQVQIVQARGNDWELPSESIWHCWMIRVIINSKFLRFGGSDRRDWEHPCRVVLGYFSWIEDMRRVIPLRTQLIGYLFHKEHIRITRSNRNIGKHVEFRRLN